MPSIEFLGYDKTEQSELEQTLKQDLKDLNFSHEIVFVIFDSQVRDLAGNSQAYLRISTRNEDKANILLERLQHYADVEFIKSQAILFKTVQ